MAVPKKRRSKAKKRTKRACWKIDLPNLRPCTSCGSLVVSHRACLVCGQYKGRQVIQLKQKKAESKDS